MAHALESGDFGLPLEPSTQTQSDKFEPFRTSETHLKAQQSTTANPFLPALSFTSTTAKPGAHLGGEIARSAADTVSPTANISKTGAKAISEQGLFQSAVALNAIAENKDLAFKLTGGSDTITRENIDKALLIDQTLRDPKGNIQYGPPQFLTDTERQRLVELRNNWNGITTSGALDATQLSKFSSQSLITSLGKETAEAITNGVLTGITAGTTKPIHKGFVTDGTAGTKAGAEAGGAGAAVGKLSESAASLIGKAIAGMQTVAKVPTSPYTQQRTPLDTDHVKDAGESVFDKIDEDHDGFLSKKELGKAVSEKKFQGQEAQVVATMYNNIVKLQELSDDEIFTDDDGITKKDLEAFDRLDAKKRREVTGLSGCDLFIRNGFAAADKDHDGFLTRSEAIQALGNKNLTADERRILSHIRDNVGEIEEASDDEWFWENDGVTKKDLEAHFNNWSRDGSEAKLTGALSWIIQRTSKSQQPDISRELFANNSPASAIKPEAISQGTIGDCYFLAALAGVARQNPDVIKNMIKDNKNGTYTVTFPNDKSHPVTVSAPTDAELGLYNGGSKYGTWAIVAEKAFGRYQQLYKGKGGYTPAEGGDGGGRMETANKLLTGKDSNKLMVPTTSEADLAKAMQDAFTSKPPKEITCGIYGNKGKNGRTAGGYPTGHAYTIVGFTPDGKGGGEVVVRNPWGGQDGTTNGTTKLSIQDFKKNFSDVVISKN